MDEMKCEVCDKPLPSDPLEECLCRDRQDAIWYTTTDEVSGWEYVKIFSVEGKDILSIERYGASHFRYRPTTDAEWIDIRVMSELVAVGILNDSDIERAVENDLLDTSEGGWFEIYNHDTERYLDTDVMGTLDEAYAYVVDFLADKENEKDENE